MEKMHAMLRRQEIKIISRGRSAVLEMRRARLCLRPASRTCASPSELDSNVNCSGRRKKAMWLTALLLVVSSHAFAQGPAGGEYGAALDRAEQLFGRGDLDGVIQELKPWVERDASLAEAQHGLGLAYYQKPDFIRAIRHLSAALPLEPENSPQWKQTVEILAMAYYFSNRAQDALPLLEKAVSWSRGDTNISYTLAMAYLATHDGPNTRRSFAELFGIDPESPQAYVLAADLMSQENYVDDAEAMILAALEKQPDLPLVAHKLGLIALTRGRFEQAAEYFRKELVSNPGHSNAWHYLGDAYFRLGRFDEAVDPLQRAIWLNLRSARSYVLLAKVYSQQERYFVAENTLKRAIDMDPRNYEAHFQLARIYHRTNRPALAKKQMAVADELRQSMPIN